MNKKNLPLISIIVPIYRVEAYLERCVTSIQQQSYEKIEILLIDDGSDDDCGEMCDIIANNDKRVRVFHQSNKGLSAARNVGIENSNGEYLIFIDSDDYINHDMIKRLYIAIEKYDADIAMCGFDMVYEDGRIEKTVFNSKHRVQLLSGKDATKRLMQNLEPTMIVAWNKLVKSSVWNTMRFPEGKQHEDDFTTYRLFYEAERIVIINEQLYHYFQRANSIIGSGFSEKSLHKIEAYIEARKYFRSKDKQLFQRATNIVLIMNKRCCLEAKNSAHVNKNEILKALRKNGRRFYLKNFFNIKRDLKYHVRLIGFYFF